MWKTDKKIVVSQTQQKKIISKSTLDRPRNSEKPVDNFMQSEEEEEKTDKDIYRYEHNVDTDSDDDDDDCLKMKQTDLIVSTNFNKFDTSSIQHEPESYQRGWL